MPRGNRIHKLDVDLDVIADTPLQTGCYHLRHFRKPAAVGYDVDLQVRHVVLDQLELADTVHCAKHIDAGQRVHDGAVAAHEKIGLSTGDFGDYGQAAPVIVRLALMRTMSPVRYRMNGWAASKGQS